MENCIWQTVLIPWVQISLGGLVDEAASEAHPSVSRQAGGVSAKIPLSTNQHQMDRADTVWRDNDNSTKLSSSPDSQFNVVLNEKAANLRPFERPRVEHTPAQAPSPKDLSREVLVRSHPRIAILLLEARWSRCQADYLQLSCSYLTQHVSTIPHQRSLTRSRSKTTKHHSSFQCLLNTVGNDSLTGNARLKSSLDLVILPMSSLVSLSSNTLTSMLCRSRNKPQNHSRAQAHTWSWSPLTET